MENQKAVGMVIGSLFGCVLAGIFAYLQISIVITCIVLVISLYIGYNWKA